MIFTKRIIFSHARLCRVTNGVKVFFQTEEQKNIYFIYEAVTISEFLLSLMFFCLKISHSICQQQQRLHSSQTSNRAMN